MNNADIIKEFIETVLNQKNFDDIDQFISPHFQTHSLHINPRPVTTGSSPKTFKEALIQSQSVFTDFKRKIEDIISEGDKVVVRHSTEGIHSGDFMGIAPTGKHFRFSGISIYKVKDGRIVDEWYIWDRQGLLDQLKKI